jgi:hypothetical protein
MPGRHRPDTGLLEVSLTLKFVVVVAAVVGFCAVSFIYCTFFSLLLLAEVRLWIHLKDCMVEAPF